MLKYFLAKKIIYLEGVIAFELAREIKCYLADGGVRIKAYSRCIINRQAGLCNPSCVQKQ